MRVSSLILAVAVFLFATSLPLAGPVGATADFEIVEATALPANPEPRILGQGQGEPAPPNPLIYLDIWLFGGLILLVMLVVAAKYLWKAFQPDDRDPSERLQPWEDPDYPYDEYDDSEDRD